MGKSCRIEHFPLHPLGTVKPLASPGGRGHGGGGDHATSSSSSKGPGGRINFHPTGIYTKLLPLAGWREDIVCQRDGSGQGDSGSFSWLYHWLLARAGWPGLLPDSTQTAGSCPVTRKENSSSTLQSPSHEDTPLSAFSADRRPLEILAPRRSDHSMMWLRVKTSGRPLTMSPVYMR